MWLSKEIKAGGKDRKVGSKELNAGGKIEVRKLRTDIQWGTFSQNSVEAFVCANTKVIICKTSK